MTLDATGERFMPEMRGETALEHMHRYLFAREVISEGAAVLDVASGEGYGSALLSAKAGTVVGVDVSRSAAEHAQRKYGNDRVKFLTGDACALPLPSASIDFIVSFETIEHVADHEKMLGEFVRVLKPSGVVIISSPDKYRYSMITGYSNEFHVKELFSHEFQQLMRQYFSNVVFGGQRNMFGTVIDFPDTASRDVSFSLAEGDIARFEDVPEPMYLIAIASRADLPLAVRGVCIDHVTESDAFQSMSKIEHHSSRLEGELDREKVKVIDLARNLFEERERNAVLRTDLATQCHNANLLAALCDEREEKNNVLSKETQDLAERLAGAEHRYNAVENSTAWRVTKPVRYVFSKMPLVRSAVRRVRHRAGANPSVAAPVRDDAPGEADGGAHRPEYVLDDTERMIASDIAQVFDVPYYSRQSGISLENLDNFTAAAHYLRSGYDAGLNPCEGFDTNYYRNRYPDVIEAGMHPLWHWVLHGRREGRPAVPYEQRLKSIAYAPLISAIIPNYNHAEFLEKRFDSIINQTYKNIEIIFLDDCSEDESLQIAEKFKEQYPDKIKIFSNEVNSGNVFRQWRKGVEAAQGEVIWICESDDFADETFVEKLVGSFVDPSVQIAFGRIQYCDRQGNFQDGLDGYRERAQSGIWDAPLVKPAGWWFTNAFSVSNVIANVGGCLIRRHDVRPEVWERAQQFHVLGDWYLYAEWAAGGQIVYSPEARAYFRQHERNTSVNSFKTARFYREHQELIEYLRRKWGVDDGHVLRFADALKSTFTSVAAEQLLGSFESVFDLEQVLACQHEEQHIVFAVLGFKLGGGEILPIQLANELVKQGVMVSFLVYEHTGEDPQIRALLDRSIPVYSADAARMVGMWRYVLDLRADLIHSHFCFCELLFFPDDASLPVLPYLVTLHGSYECVSFSRNIIRRLEKAVTLWVYLTEKNLLHLRDEKGQLPVGDIAFIGNGMALDDRPFPMSRSQLGLTEDDFVLAIASRCIPEKGWKQACVAVCQLNLAENGRKVHLLLCGTGDALEELVEQYGDIPEIHFLGYQDCISGLYRLADCMLLPTRFPGESFPLTLIQALQVGTPAIATEVGFVRSMMTGDDHSLAGLLLPLEEDDEIFQSFIMQAIREMMNDEERTAFAETALRCGARYGIDKVAEHYIRTYRRFRNEAIACDNQ
ncbi:glycosyltransferase [Acetobacter sp.]|jgi:ubiquinone/menaquinone biosynthesis C-methylase UbiE/glycosyltransferase involved in cell wall biosynthesis|uniref:glycosyltransferase n=1 Tax=Acetobacter sp. TaxID=440 RepID=UPI0025BCC287|nr:glycosyltransferase [Acetobacter sp.]MCH4090417.1 glycosyltransferase [Acetobacter sp.]MCI1299111.1 glycosyltransferase [Acetobacter sp.]MCI1315658.1 glycosyltransferase [Acetobacter sp.]